MKAKLLSLGKIADVIASSRGGCSKQAVAGAIIRFELQPSGYTRGGLPRYSVATARFIGSRLRQPNAKRAA